VRKIVALDDSPIEWESYAAWRERQSPLDPRVAVAGSDVVVQLYTSGTTGRPKGAQLTSDNLLALASAAVHEFRLVTDDDVSLVCMPFFHIGGLGYGLVSLYAGATNVILREVVPADILRTIAAHRVTKSFLVPAVILFLLQTPDIDETDLSSLGLISYGASPMPLELLRRAMSVFKCEFGQVYGLTETTGAITFLPPEDHDPNGNRRMRSCGKPFSTVQFRIVGGDGNDLPVGEVGEIMTRSPQNMKGYWNLPEETARAFCGEWLRTGDVGYLDEDGYLYIHDRVKDLIISGAENVYPAEVENVLFSHPAVADVAVIGVPDDQWGEAVTAMVVKRPGVEVSAEEIIAFARERMARYKAPKSVVFVETLPRNSSGKILKRELRAPYWAGRERQVS
jgi:acyl-CoA synthetase (AMP-forming)/AMP-acid ligase II